MRLTLIVAVSTVVLVIVAIWGLAVVIAPHPTNGNAAPALASIDAMQMMKGARNLPVERFGAH
jgi:hypothetical protein